MYISQGTTSLEQLKNIQQALDAGCRWIQLRFKNADHEQLLKTAEHVKRLCFAYDATFIINDSVEAVMEVGADGVHLGLNDVSVDAARIILGSHKVIGGTANTLEDVLQRVEEKCSYIGLGPFRFTNTKQHLSPVLGLERYQTIMTELKKQNIKTPVYAIGGIELNDVESLMQTGIYGIALSGALTNSTDKKEFIKQFNEIQYANA